MTKLSKEERQAKRAKRKKWREIKRKARRHEYTEIPYGEPGFGEASDSQEE